MQRIRNDTRVPELGFHDLASAFCFSLGPQIASVAIPTAEYTVLNTCGSFLTQADMGVWGLTMDLPIIQSLPSYNLGSHSQGSVTPSSQSLQGATSNQSPLPSPLHSTAYQVLLIPSSKSIIFPSLLLPPYPGHLTYHESQYHPPLGVP